MRSERYPILWVGEAAVVAVPVELDVTNAGELADCLFSVVARGARTLVVDMTATTFCDCAAVFAIVDCVRRAGAGGIRLRLAVTAPSVKQSFAIVGADRIVDAFPTVSAALMGEAGLPEHRTAGETPPDPQVPAAQ